VTLHRCSKAFLEAVVGPTSLDVVFDCVSDGLGHAHTVNLGNELQGFGLFGFKPKWLMPRRNEAGTWRNLILLDYG